MTHWHVPLLLALLLVASGETVLTLHETPRGSLQGIVVAEETGAPIADARVTLYAQFSIDGKRPPAIRLRTDDEGRFTARRIPVGQYELRAAARAHELPSMRISVLEGEMRELALELPPEPPWLDLNVQQHVFAPDETPEVACRGWVQEDEFIIGRWRVDYAKLMIEHDGYLRSLVTQADREYLAGMAASPHFEDIGQVSEPIVARDSEGLVHQRVSIPMPGPGLYVVSVEADGIRRRDWLMVTDLGLVTKELGDQVLAYAVDLKSGEPIDGVTVVAHRGRMALAAAETGADGLAELRLPASAERGELVIIASRGDSLAAIESYHWRPEAEAHRVYVYTDRPVYRPGHSVRYKGVFRKAVDDRYEVPQPQKVTVEVHDDLDTLIHKAELESSERGSFHDGFDLPSTASTGRYQLTTTIAGRPYHSNFSVAAYKKPEYSVTVRPEEPRYVRGDEASVAIEARYYFGMPVAGAEVTYWVYRSPYWFGPSYEYEYGSDEYEYYDYGDIVTQGETTTDAQGIARILVDTTVDEEEWLEVDHRFRVEAWVSDASDRSVTQSGSFIVTRGEFAVTVRPDRYASMPYELATINLQAMDYDNNPRANVVIDVSIGPEEWLDGELEYDEQQAESVTTDSAGKATVSFTPKEEGRYRISATTQDARGNRIADSDYLWVTGYTYSSLPYKYPDLEIITDKRAFEIGETVTAMINTKAAGATALVTIEGEKLHEWWTQELEGNSTTIRIPVRPEYMPNVYLSVCYVKDKEFAKASKSLSVSSRSRSLIVEVEADKEVYRPADTATYRIKTTRPDGRPVSAEVSLGVVDESIYAIREEPGPDILPFFYRKRSNLVDTSYSFPRLYLGNGDKAGDERHVRKWFPDTAFWEPAVITDEQGEAQVQFTIPDTLTTWRATARAHTLDTALGSTVAKVRCTKDFLVRLQTPRFLNQRDEVTISGIVHNDTGQAQQVAVALSAPDFEGAQPKRTAAVQQGKQYRADWLLTGSLLGQWAITVDAVAGQLHDAMQLSIPVLPHGRERVEWRNGTVSSAATEKLRIRDDAVPGASTVRIMLTPSVASAMLGSLEYLVSYPYGCTEQTMSGFLPDVIVARALRELNLEQPEIEAKLPDMVRTGLLKLYGYQLYDGGWSWGRYGDADPWMTGYVVFGLLQAKAAGFSVNERVLDDGLRAVRRLAESKGVSRGDRAYLCYVLASAGPRYAQTKLLSDLLRNVGADDARALAYLVLSCLYVGDRENAERAMIALWRKATGGPTFTYWESSGQRRGGETDTEATALALKAAVYLQPDDPRIPKIARWLVLNRRGNHWYSTRDTAMILYALSDFLKHSDELEPDFDATVTLGGEPVGEPIHFDRSSIFEPQVELVVTEGLEPGDNDLSIDKSGAGNLYYSVRFGQYVGTEDLPIVVGGSGIVIERNYYKLSLQRDDVSGSLRLMPSKSPRREFQSGDLIRARVSVRSTRGYEYMMIEDPIPAGCEVIERGDMSEWEWEYWWSDVDVRDEMVSFFARSLPQGRRIIEYMLRAQIPGKYHVMPTRAYGMYQPEIRGDGPENRIEIEG